MSIKNTIAFKVAAIEVKKFLKIDASFEKKVLKYEPSSMRSGSKRSFVTWASKFDSCKSNPTSIKMKINN